MEFRCGVSDGDGGEAGGGGGASEIEEFASEEMEEGGKMRGSCMGLASSSADATSTRQRKMTTRGSAILDLKSGAIQTSDS